MPNLQISGIALIVLPEVKYNKLRLSLGRGRRHGEGQLSCPGLVPGGAGAPCPMVLQRLKGQGLWRWVEGESGLAEEHVDELWPALDAAEPGTDQGLELIQGGGGVVAHPGLHAGPGALSGLAVMQGSLGEQL